MTNAVAPPLQLYPTWLALPLEDRIQIIPLPNQRLADGIDLTARCKQAHWNLKGPGFIALHRLFDEIHAAVDEYVDLLAERIVQLGGTARTGIAEMEILGDSVSADILTEIARGVDKWLWFVEAHQQNRAEGVPE